MDDEELLRRIAARDETAFRELYARHSAAVYGLLCRLAGRGSLASDLLHETWLRGVRHLPLFRGQSAFDAWLAEIALNCYRDWRRRHARDAPPGDADVQGGQPGVAPPEHEEERIVTALCRRGLLRRRRRSAAILWGAIGGALLVLSAWAFWP
ncbi:MAG TPA: sigma factor [Vicinamibacterales bacterium]|nr:sigma factor [Vicinamibacterales bacterium]